MSKHYNFRAWGRPDWLRNKFGTEGWSIVACLGSERRSASSAVNIFRAGDHLQMIRIDDPLVGTESDNDKLESAIAMNAAVIEESGCANKTLVRADLKASLDEIRSCCIAARELSPNVILDITSFPKRWFFPMVRYLIEDDGVENLQIVYTKGTEHAAVLSENPEVLRQIPSFISDDDRTDHDSAFVGVGFHTHSMLELFGQDKAKSLQLLFPFPPGPPGIIRNWKFVQAVEMKVQKDEQLGEGADPINYLHLDACDVSQVFDTLSIVTQNGDKTSIMAPYGPKPFSLAMCLFAVAAEKSNKPEVPMWYSQPQKYAIDYTKEAATRNGELDSWAYAIKRSGRFLYEL